MKQKKSMRLLGILLAVLFCLSSAAAAYDLIPVGRTAGIRMDSDGVLVTGLNSVATTAGEVWPAKQAGVLEGDIILKVNGDSVSSNEELQKAIALSQNKPAALTIQRNGKSFEINVTPTSDRDGVGRIGVLARDSIAGIGTITYVDPKTGAYGSLGHGICDADTGVLLPLRKGQLTESTVVGVQKGKAGEPGSLQGEFVTEHTLGSVEKNTNVGIFGHLFDDSYYHFLSAVPVAMQNEVTVGKAEIISNIAGQNVERYTIEIVKLYDENDAYGRSMMLRVTDSRLLNATGGIVQGMSGSPIMQNGKLVGAVTHVLVNDPTRGYGVFLEEMLREMNH